MIGHPIRTSIRGRRSGIGWTRRGVSLLGCCEVKSLAAKRSKVRNWSTDSTSMNVLYASGRLSFVGQFAHGRSHRVTRPAIKIIGVNVYDLSPHRRRVVAQTVVTESTITSLDSLLLNASHSPIGSHLNTWNGSQSGKAMVIFHSTHVFKITIKINQNFKHFY